MEFQKTGKKKQQKFMILMNASSMIQGLKFLCFLYLMVYLLFIKTKVSKQSINKQMHNIAIITFIHTISLYTCLSITIKAKEERSPWAYFVCEQLSMPWQGSAFTATLYWANISRMAPQCLPLVFLTRVTASFSPYIFTLDPIRGF